MGAKQMISSSSIPGPAPGAARGLVPSAGTVTESLAAAAAAAAAASESDLDSEPEVRCSDSVRRATLAAHWRRRPGGPGHVQVYSFRSRQKRTPLAVAL